MHTLTLLSFLALSPLTLASTVPNHNPILGLPEDTILSAVCQTLTSKAYGTEAGLYSAYSVCANSAAEPNINWNFVISYAAALPGNSGRVQLGVDDCKKGLADAVAVEQRIGGDGRAWAFYAPWLFL